MFEWQTEDETDWEEVPAPPKTAEPRKLPWLTVFLILVAVSSLSAVVYYQVQSQIARQTATIEQNVLATHRFIQELAINHDKELFLPQLSGRDPHWTDVQVQLLEAGLLFNPRPFGLTSLPFTQSTPATVTLSADLQAAEVTTQQSFTMTVEAGMTETVQLQQTAVYRISTNGRWLLAPPIGDFWGEWKTIHTQYLMLVYPERDAAIAEKLAFDLNDLLRRLCRDVDDLKCPTDLHVRLRLDSDPESLLLTADFRTLVPEGDSLELPAPTLIGLPVDEAGYEVLYRGYGAAMVSALVAELVEYECCHHLPFFRVLLDKQLDQLGLRPWPLNPAAYELVYQTFDPTTDGDSWRAEDLDLDKQEWFHLYSLIEYLLETADTTPAAMQREFSKSSSYLNWLFTMLPGMDHATYLDIHLRNYAFHHSTTGLQPPPVPFPNQKIALACSTESGTILYQYSFADDEWTQRFTRESTENRYYVGILPLLDGSGYAIQEAWPAEGNNTQARISLWRPEGEVTVLEQPQKFGRGLYIVNWWGGYPEQYWVINGVGSNGTDMWVFEPSRCHPGQCEVRQLLGWPMWSPDETQTLMEVIPSDGEAPYELYRGDALGGSAVKVGEGLAFNWLDNEHYIYARLIDDEQVEWVVASTADDVPQVLFQAEDFLPAIPEAERPSQLVLDYVQPRPDSASPQLLVLVRDAPRPSAVGHYFLWENGKITWLRQEEYPGWATFSPDGRWLIFQNQRNRYGALTSVELFNIEDGTSVVLDVNEFFQPSWSADGEWLVYNDEDENTLVLYAPAYDYKQFIPYYVPNCYSFPVWGGER